MAICARAHSLSLARTHTHFGGAVRHYRLTISLGFLFGKNIFSPLGCGPFRVNENAPLSFNYSTTFLFLQRQYIYNTSHNGAHTDTAITI